MDLVEIEAFGKGEGKTYLSSPWIGEKVCRVLIRNYEQQKGVSVRTFSTKSFPNSHPTVST